ncbi:S66 peptidase family protein [Saliterribacillus persicus]|uniref:Muramoyltetrapeptide carboxypeptidase n=1 Tax=Saliterribacillus persicus TaxID=930114 RepID=A0A368YBS3_9BACI|nr:LD-carboxypeptidase [Saliterribacillus persicus]RCW76786.1 muramoyltetrapeptide carboxypeptidase [Saliterribacillus persicus]
MIKPCALKEGDRVAIIAPAGPPDREKLIEGKRVLEKMGLEVSIGRYVFDGEGDLAALDQKRVADLHEAFCDPSIRGIFCANGGFGSARIAPMIDYAKIQRNPKIFWGYSDITYLLNAIQNFSNLVTFHGPMIASDLHDEQRTVETESSFFELFTKEDLNFDSSKSPLIALAHGTGEGQLVGGNLTLLTNGLGTPFQINTDGNILLIEEVAEPAFRIDAMLTQLKQAGLFDNLEGLVIGTLQVEPDQYPKIKKVLQDLFAEAPFPVVENFPIGHCKPNYGVPLGVQAKLTTSPPRLMIESGVT